MDYKTKRWKKKRESILRKDGYPYAKGGIYIFIVMVLATIALGFMLRRVRQDAVQQQFNDMIRP